VELVARDYISLNLYCTEHLVGLLAVVVALATIVQSVPHLEALAEVAQAVLALAQPVQPTLVAEVEPLKSNKMPRQAEVV
jgi:hypothetical protein